MYKHYSRPKSQGSSFIAILSFASIAYAGMMALSPQKTESIDSRVFVEGVTIHLNHNAPPVAALEDVLLEADFGDDQIPQVKTYQKIELVSGRNSFQEVAEKIVQENRENRNDNYNVAAQEAIPSFEMQTYPAPKTPGTQVKNIDLRAVGVTREELLDALFIPMIHHDPGVINRGGQNRILKSLPVAQNNLAPGDQLIEPHSKKREPAFLPAFAAETSKQSFSTSIDPNKQFKINGAIEMSQGLAFTSPKDRIVVFHEDKGQALENAVVWTKEGRFEIGVGSRSGLLVAELRTQAGEILGSGRATMDQNKILIRIAPTSQGLVGRVVAANSSDEFDPQPLKSAKLEVDMIPHEFVSEVGGKFSDPNLVNQSTMILKSQKPGYISGISIASAGSENLIPMYSNKMVAELLSLQKNADKVNNPDGEQAGPVDMNNMSIVWGRITKNGDAVAGGQVEMLTADQNLRPVYFNKMMIPDLSMTATSANGYYAFVGVNPGVQALQVNYSGGLSEPSVIPADSNKVSQLNIDVAKTKVAEVLVFDGFQTAKSLPANLLRLGQSSGLETDINGQAKLHYSEGTGLMILDVDAGPEYELTRLTLSRNKNTIYAPVVSQAWFEEIRKQAGLDVIAYTGSIMGFIQSRKPYRAAFGERVSDTTRIIYFDSKGEIVPGEVGVPGGGFIIFNAPEGLLTVSVLTQDSDKILTQASYVDRGVVNVFSHAFR